MTVVGNECQCNLTQTLIVIDFDICVSQKLSCLFSIQISKYLNGPKICCKIATCNKILPMLVCSTSDGSDFLVIFSQYNSIAFSLTCRFSSQIIHTKLNVSFID